MLRNRILVAVLGGTLMLVGCAGIGATASFNDEAVVSERIDSVRLTGGTGNVTVRVGDTVTVSRVVHYTDERPGVTHRVDGSALVLGGCPQRDCWVDYDVVVPRGSTVAGESSSGDVELIGLAGVQLRVNSGSVTTHRVTGAVTLDVDSGDTTVREVGGPVSVRSDSGGVRLSGVRGNVAVQASSGDVRGERLAGAKTSVSASSGGIMLSPGSRQDVRAEVDSGDIELTVPDGRYRVRSHVESGEQDIAVRDDPAARHELNLRADSGHIDVRYR
ncbi:MAG: DUF4097 family beta strand repeat protein [Pseudonocardiaceae bacterium]|nr:DUF4097 family beta strand repeat protein [Pseudonocardiaceae bacterium]